MAEKRFYWLKLKDDYFNNPKIKKLRKIAGGDTFTIIYLKMQLLSVSNKGIIEFEGIEPTIEEELALKLDEELDNVTVTLNYLKLQGLIESNNNEFLLLDACKNIGSECDSAERVRAFRDKEKKQDIVLKEPKSNALRQRQFKAKEICKQVQHIPFIEDYTNNKRYSGNYYIVLKRDKMKCSICSGIENLCVHHIDGYNELKPENNAENKMITLCRNCHSNVHSHSLEIPEEILQSIDYYFNNNENNEMCNASVTPMLQSSISNISNSNIYINKFINNKIKEQPQELQQVLQEFLKMRKAIKKPMTERAFEMLLNKLNKMSQDTQVQIKILEQSILHCWQDVYELKQENNAKQTSQRVYDKAQLDGLYDNLEDIEF